MQVTVMGQCLNALLPSDGRTIENRVRAAAEMGITRVEPFGGTWPAGVDCRRTAEAVRREGDSRGVAFPAFGSNTRIGEPGEGGARALATLKQEVEACRILGAGVLTCAAIDAQPVTPEASPGFALPFERAIRHLLEPLRELAAYGAERGVRVAVLNHCSLVYLSWHQEWLARLVEGGPAGGPGAGDASSSGGTAVGAAVDPGNYLYYGSEDPIQAVRRLAPYAALVRIGDFRPRPEEAVRAGVAAEGRLSLWESAPLGEGVVDHVHCLRLLRQAGYQGIVSLKSPGPPIPDAAEALRRALDRLRRWVKEA
jgi:sugar phosphate isomerase/epimerase